MLIETLLYWYMCFSYHLSQDAAADALFVVMQQSYCEYLSQKYIWAVNAAPELAIIAATDLQLQSFLHISNWLFTTNSGPYLSFRDFCCYSYNIPKLIPLI